MHILLVPRQLHLSEKGYLYLNISPQIMYPSRRLSHLLFYFPQDLTTHSTTSHTTVPILLL